MRFLFYLCLLMMWRAPSYALDMKNLPAHVVADFSNAHISLFDVQDGYDLIGNMVALYKPASHGANRRIPEEILRDDDVLVVVDFPGGAKAYPVRLLERHGVVNDEQNGVPFTLVYDPFSGVTTAIVRKVGDRTTRFYSSGLFYEGQMLLMTQSDRKTKGARSLFWPLRLKMVTGPYSGEELRQLPVYFTYMREFRKEHPTGLVASLYHNSLGGNESFDFETYRRGNALAMPLRHMDERIGLREDIIGVRLIPRDKKKIITAAIPRRILEYWPDALTFILGESKIPLRLAYKSPGSLPIFSGPKGMEVAVFFSFWGPWASTYPETILIDRLP